MEVIDAIWRRASIRSFKPDPVSKETLHQILEIALRAPSWTNVQPWEFAIVGGEPLARLKKALAERAANQDPPAKPDIPWPVFLEPYDRRRKELGYGIYGVKNIPRDDQQKKLDWYLKGVQFFDAPAAIILYVDRSLNEWAILDVGHLSMCILLTAQEFKLGACSQAAPTRFPEVIRKELGIPDSKLILTSIAIGYPNRDDPINSLRSTRDPVEKFAHCYGLD
ncbi:MAG: nitroreductase family protein [Dehalococcoidia bacterium]|nr:nitroreductase family protein [Dehalococcoidia bacterium]